MRFKIGDYVEGYTTSDKRMLITYTKGWVVKAEYTGRKLVITICKQRQYAQ